MPAAALRRLAAADAFRPGLGLSRREALWAVRGPSDAPLPLFAAADARDGVLRPERAEPAVALAAMTAGREVAEDYRTTALSLRQHPLAFLRADLTRTGHVRCADLCHLRSGGRVEVAGLVLIRQKPGSAKGVMFITLEDEGGVANLIVWPQLFERQRALVLTAGLLSCRGRIQHQGRVTHVVAEHLTDLTFWLRRIGDLDLGRLPTGRADEARHGGSPDLRDRTGERATGSEVAAPLGGKPRDIFIPDLRIDGSPAPDEPQAAPALRVRSRDFR